uniref:Protein TIFY n=1 Tax=Dianthus caryophyllus TaxID=3570 RepID=D4QD68_DIACA|nr:JAZ-like protein [Dianthus caryophyllus]
MSNDSSSKFATAQKMSFAQTCNLLSQYVKEKRAAEGFTRSSTMNLFPVKQSDDSNATVGRTINLFPQISGFDSRVNKRASPEPPSAQMTIFYGGQVVVFNDLPADKANEVINLASSFESDLKKRKIDAPVSPVPISEVHPTLKPSISQNSNAKPNLPQTGNLTMGVPLNFGNNVTPAATAAPRVFVRSTADCPIARKASLHRFLEKRKDRLVEKAPAPENAANGGATKAVDGNSWLGLNSLPIFQKQQQ